MRVVAPVAALRELGLPEKFLIFPAQTWPHKNHDVLIKAVGLLRQRGREVVVALSGSQTDRLAYLQDLVERHGVGSHIHFLGRVDEKILKALYVNCAGMVFPSGFEGFRYAGSRDRDRRQACGVQ